LNKFFLAASAVGLAILVPSLSSATTIGHPDDPTHSAMPGQDPGHPISWQMPGDKDHMTAYPDPRSGHQDAGGHLPPPHGGPSVPGSDDPGAAPSPVPVPAGLPLVLTGALALVGLRRLRRRG